MRHVRVLALSPFFPFRNVILFVWLVVAPVAWCQEQNLRRFEIGGQVTDMRAGACFGYRDCLTPQIGLGPAIAFNLNRNLALEGDLNLTPGVDRMPFYFDDGSVTGGRATEVLTGVRAEKRARNYGFFLDAKPGLLSWSQAVSERRIFFVTKVGGGVEYSLSPRIHLRVDVGDLLVRYHNVDCDECTHWTSNLQSTVGMYWGMGRSVAWDATPRRGGQHNFFSKSNLVLVGLSLLGQTADAVTTQRNLSHGAREEDPFAAPFVKYGWSGQIGLGVLANGAEILAMYGLHRMGEHWIERAVPLSIATASAFAAYGNDRDE